MLVPLSAIKPSRANPRTDLGDIKQLADSILENGLIVPLTVQEMKPDRYQVIDGHRRLAALNLIHDGDTRVEVMVRESDGSDVLAIIANTERLPLHPVDQYKAIAELNHLTEQQIAARFVLPTKRVRQIVALGKISPKILAAWREGKITEDAARSFTLEPDHKKQEKVFKSLTKTGSYGGGAYHVRQAILDHRANVVGILNLIDDQTYINAGGSITYDLFNDTAYVSDPALLDSLAEPILNDIKRKLTDAGWTIDEYDWEKHTRTYKVADEWGLEDALKGPVDEYTLVNITTDGHSSTGLYITNPFKVKEGWVEHPDEDDEMGEAGDEQVEVEEEEVSSSISNALRDEVRKWRTQAYRRAFAISPLAFSALLITTTGARRSNVIDYNLKDSSLTSNWWEKVETGDEDDWVNDQGGSFGHALADAMQSIAHEMAVFITTDYAKAKDIATLSAMIPASRLRTCLVREFKAQEYFDRSPRPLIEAFLTDVAQYPFERSAKKKSLAKIAADAATALRWLPPLMIEHTTIASVPDESTTTFEEQLPGDEGPAFRDDEMEAA